MAVFERLADAAPEREPSVPFPVVGEVVYPHQTLDAGARLLASLFYYARAAVWDAWQAPDSDALDPSEHGGTVAAARLWREVGRLRRLCDDDVARFTATVAAAAAEPRPPALPPGMAVVRAADGALAIRLAPTVFLPPASDNDDDDDGHDHGEAAGDDGGAGTSTVVDLPAGAQTVAELW